jgi:hypothetical protein
MKWFKHDSDASNDAKIKKLIIRHGAVGYAVYFHCIELITADISENNLTYELEHDSEIIADNLKITGDSTKSGIEIVENIMKTIINLGLFNESNNKIVCYKLAKRLDSSMTSNPKFREQIKKSHDLIMIESCKTRLEETRLDNTRKEKNKKSTPKAEKKLFLDCVKLTDSEYQKLLDKFNLEDTLDKIEKLNNYIMSKGKKYSSHYHTILNWSKKDEPKKHQEKSYEAPTDSNNPFGL